jgi:hypothetical protein
MENTTPNGWDSVDTSSDSVASVIARMHAVPSSDLSDALHALEIMIDGIRDAQTPNEIASLKMQAFMVRCEYLEPMQRAVAAYRSI